MPSECILPYKILVFVMFENIGVDRVVFKWKDIALIKVRPTSWTQRKKLDLLKDSYSTKKWLKVRFCNYPSFTEFNWPTQDLVVLIMTFMCRWGRVIPNLFLEINTKRFLHTCPFPSQCLVDTIFYFILLFHSLSITELNHVFFFFYYYVQGTMH